VPFCNPIFCYMYYICLLYRKEVEVYYHSCDDTNCCQKYNSGLILLHTVYTLRELRAESWRIWEAVPETVGFHLGWCNSPDKIHRQTRRKHGLLSPQASRRRSKEYMVFLSHLRSVCALITRLMCGPNISFMTAVLLAILHCHGYCRCRGMFFVI
jgi:hypothetical protein